MVWFELVDYNQFLITNKISITTKNSFRYHQQHQSEAASTVIIQIFGDQAQVATENIDITIII